MGINFVSVTAADRCMVVPYILLQKNENEELEVANPPTDYVTLACENICPEELVD